MIDKFFLLQEALYPLACIAELLLCELRLARRLCTLQRLKLLLCVEVLPSDPLHELLVVNLTGHRHLKVIKGFLGSFYGHCRVIQVWESIVTVV